MKRFILSLALIPVLGFGIYVSAANEGKQDNTVTVLYDSDKGPKIDANFLNTATVHLNETEYYIFAPGKIFVKRTNHQNQPKLTIKALGDDGSAIIYNDNGGVVAKNTCDINNAITLGLGGDNVSSGKFVFGNKNVFLYNVNHSNFKIPNNRILVDTTALGPNMKFRNDTILVGQSNANVAFLKIIKPKYASLHSVELNEHLLLSADSLEHSLWKSKIFDASLSDHKPDGKLNVKLLVLDDKGQFTVEQTHTYVIQPTKKSSRFVTLIKEYYKTILIILGLIVLISLIVAFAYKLWVEIKGRKSSSKAKKVKEDDGVEEQNHNDSVEASVTNENKPEEKVEVVTSPSEEVNHPAESQEANEPEVVSDVAPTEESEAEKDSEPEQETEPVDYENKIAELEKQLKDKDQEISDLQRSARENSQKVNRLESRINEFQKEVNAKQNKIDNLTATLESKEGIIRSKDEEISNGKNQINQQKEKIVNMQNEHNQKVGEMQSAHEQQINLMRKDHQEQVDKMRGDYTQHISDLNTSHETASKNLQDQIDVLQSKINDTINSWNNDKKGIVAFFARYVEKIDKYVNIVLNDADQDAPAYMEISQMADSMNGYLAFKTKALEIISQDLPINEIESQISELILNDLKYEKSWFNTIARLYAYSQVSELNSAFGYYDTIAEDMKALFRAMENLSEVFAVTEIVVPELFKDEFTSKKYDYKNTNLVLPQIHPNYAEMLNPMAVYDFSIVGYTYEGVTNKPVVAYNTKS